MAPSYVKREQNSNKLTIGLLPEAGRKAVQVTIKQNTSFDAVAACFDQELPRTL
jgi:hypothetical protein